MNSMAILQANEMALPKPFLEQNNIRPKKAAEYRASQYCQKTKIIQVTANYTYEL